jgi:hypothetical protein
MRTNAIPGVLANLMARTALGEYALPGVGILSLRDIRDDDEGSR